MKKLMDILFEDKVKIGSSMSKAIDFLNDPKQKIFILGMLTEVQRI